MSYNSGSTIIMHTQETVKYMYVPKSSTSGTKSNGVLPDLGTAPGAGADSSGVAVFLMCFAARGCKRTDNT